MVVKYASSLLSTYKKTGSHGKSIKAEEKNLPHATTKTKSGGKKTRNKKRANKDNTNCPSYVPNGLAMFFKGHRVLVAFISMISLCLLGNVQGLLDVYGEEGGSKEGLLTQVSHSLQ